jgi:hypothetical protein
MTERFGEDESGLLIVGPVRLGEKGVLLSGYIGPSMNPTLYEGDVLEVTPVANGRVRLGDVVFFRNPSGRGYIVHRAAAIVSSGVMPRGDNNPRPDGHLLGAPDILGRVVAARRRNRRRIIRGGWRGFWRGRLLILSRPVKRSLSRILHKSYRRIAEAGLVSGLLPKAVRPRCVETEGMKGGKRLHLVFLGKVVGRFSVERGVWMIRRPYRVFVDESSLPRLRKTE